MFGISTKELSSTMKDSETCVDPQLWHACAGSMVHIPSVNSRVYYFPQGHAEHSHSQVDFSDSSVFIPSCILSRVTTIKFMADPETDEVFAKIHLLPIRTNVVDFDEDEELAEKVQEKTTSFAKTLTQSDANNGGGFSVPRYCAETIFPKLDYSAEPPVQTVLAKDVHGQMWKFRHIYRGTPRRHLLTTGWSSFVNQKKLMAGDSIVFLRTDNGDLCVGIRRAKRGGIGGWDPSHFSLVLKEEENNNLNIRGKGRVRSESVLEAVRLAASGKPFEVVYFPRASTPEFCVKAAAVRAAMRFCWCSGMRFKMAFETEDSSRIGWFMGTISSVQVADPIRWSDSPWRLLQVAWDEPDLLQNVKRVNPWLIELISNMPAIHLAPFTPPRKKLRIPSDPNFPLESHQFLTAPFSNPFREPKSIQGARHAQYGHTAFSDLHPKNLHSGLFHGSFHEDIECLLTIGSPSTKKSECNGNGKKRPQLILFGQTILTEEQISLSSGYCSSDENNEKGANISSSDGSASVSGSHHQSGVESYPSWLKEDHQEIELNTLEMHHSGGYFSIT